MGVLVMSDLVMAMLSKGQVVKRLRGDFMGLGCLSGKLYMVQYTHTNH